MIEDILRMEDPMNKFKIVKSLLMNLPVSLTMSFVAQWVNILHGHMQHFEWGSMAVSFCFPISSPS